MKRKVLVTMLCLAISVSAIACGTENTTEQLEATATEQTVETEEVETETQEVETQETETQETADNVEETENYEELVSVPVDGRDGSKENPYQVGDTIYFPKVVVGWDNDYETAIFSPLTVVVEEATSEYVKISQTSHINFSYAP